MHLAAKQASILFLLACGSNNPSDDSGADATSGVDAAQDAVKDTAQDAVQDATQDATQDADAANDAKNEAGDGACIQASQPCNFMVDVCCDPFFVCRSMSKTCEHCLGMFAGCGADRDCCNNLKCTNMLCQ